jgi:SAM-dependent methyltransferase
LRCGFEDGPAFGAARPSYASRAMADRGVQDYWSRVGEHIAARPDEDPSAGDASPYIAHQSRLVTERLVSQMPVEGRSVLEVGCGPGGKLEDVNRLGPSRLVGADLSPVMVELARKRLAGSGVEIVQIDGGAYPFANGEFDLTYTCTVLHHNPDPALPGIVAEIARVSARHVFLIEATARRPRSASEAFHLRSVQHYERLLDEHGFELVEERPLGTYCSELLATAAMRVGHSRHLRQPPYREGAPVTPLHRRIERIGLPVSTMLDRVVPQQWGLSGMHFERSSSR